MPRAADKPGTYRILTRFDGTNTLSGVRSDGSRVKVPGLSAVEAESMAKTLFGGETPKWSAPNYPENNSPNVSTTPVNTFLDDWGLPKISPETAQSVASAIGIPPPQPPTPTVAQVDAKVQEQKIKDAEIQAARKKYAKSLMELVGTGYASGIVMGSRRVVSNFGKEPCKVDAKQVKDLAEVSSDTFKELLGDMEVKPWIMMILLSLGIPISMWIQSPKRQIEQASQSPELKSVP